MPIAHDFLFSTPFDGADWLGQQALFSPDQFSINHRKAYVTVKAYVEEWDKLKNCVRYLMGGAWVMNNSQKLLHRELPARHPIYPSLICTEILALQGVEPDGNEEPVQPAKLRSSRYEKFLIEAAFTSPPYVIDTDRNVHDLAAGEMKRYTVIETKPYTEQIVMEGGQLVFEAPGKDWDAQPILSSRPIVKQRKTAYTITVHHIPLSLVQDDEGTYPSWDDAAGCISATSFLGKPAGTFLLESVEPHIYVDPIETDANGARSRYCDATFNLKFFDPPRGLTTETRRGWNLAPAYDGLYYWAKNPETGQGQHQTFDMNDLLTHWSLV